jgi:hypothetical protein
MQVSSILASGWISSISNFEILEILEIHCISRKKNPIFSHYMQQKGGLGNPGNHVICMNFVI